MTLTLNPEHDGCPKTDGPTLQIENSLFKPLKEYSSPTHTLEAWQSTDGDGFAIRIVTKDDLNPQGCWLLLDGTPEDADTVRQLTTLLDGTLRVYTGNSADRITEALEEGFREVKDEMNEQHPLDRLDAIMEVAKSYLDAQQQA
ncbi:hypothetical protein A2Z33_04315 [Candidatus Gottesmanbacteria bacterium RBG_16_52_11]|uniref:Uncharacterized protein n=1 Tax=Candidatus Gottesmanbacteria bacterium RBG_16_52_11 TaxID=1798374 RepID=A0A1F5YVZ5_9BACT|nr:MAG: hypothetical protein A2Z33_04315 [Candidatus Gottesmanbacteria bacterium RBG_16_52_11]